VQEGLPNLTVTSGTFPNFVLYVILVLRLGREKSAGIKLRKKEGKLRKVRSNNLRKTFGKINRKWGGRKMNTFKVKDIRK
jgi:hypothetical protein